MSFNFDTLFYDDYYGGIKWAASGQNVTVTWSFVSDNIIVPGVAGEISVNEPDNATIAVYQQAFKLWDDALDTLTFQQNSNGNNADVAVGIVDYLTSDGYWNSSWDSGIIYNSSIRLDKDILATPSLLTTLLHEIGNVLGLGDIQSSSTIRSLQEDPFPEDFTGSSLWPDDIAMIKQLYEEPIIIETDASEPLMTYIVPTSGSNINHTGIGATVNANVDVSTSSVAILINNNGTGSTTITAAGTVKGGVGRNETTTGINPAGISAVNATTATNLTITAKDVSGQGYGIYAENLGTSTTEISVSGVIVGSGAESKGIHTKGSEATITVLTLASVSGTAEGIKTGNTADTLTINGSVTGLNGTAILLGRGNDTINLGITATITGTISGGLGSDTANFSVAKSEVDKFTYDNTTKTAVVTISGKAISFKDFETFKFADASSGMTAEEAVSNFLVSYNPAKSIGSLADQTVASGSSVNLNEILSSSTADGGSYSWINVYDATGGNNFVKNGIEIDASAGARVSLSDLANTTIKGDNQASEQTLWFQTYDGAAYSAWDSMILTTNVEI